MNWNRMAAEVRLAGLLLLLMLVTVLTACGRSASDPASEESSRFRHYAEHAERIPVTAQVEPRQLAAFTILGSPPAELPPEVGRALEHHVFGINVDLARQIPLRSGPVDFWLLPGNGHLCLVSLIATGPSIGTICEATSAAIEHGITSVTFSHPQSLHPDRLIVGVAPDDARLALIQTGGSTAAVAIHREVFIRRDAAPDPPDSITLKK